MNNQSKFNIIVVGTKKEDEARVIASLRANKIVFAVNDLEVRKLLEYEDGVFDLILYDVFTYPPNKKCRRDTPVKIAFGLKTGARSIGVVISSTYWFELKFG